MGNFAKNTQKAKAELQKEEPNADFLLHLIDVAWNECTDSSEVPSTIWAIKIINKAKETFKG